MQFAILNEQYRRVDRFVHIVFLQLKSTLIDDSTKFQLNMLCIHMCSQIDFKVNHHHRRHHHLNRIGISSDEY